MFLIPQMLAVVHKYIHACICTFMHAYMRTYMATYHYIPNHGLHRLFDCLFVCLLACFSVCYMVDWFTLGVCGRAFDDSCWKFIVRFYFEHPLTFEAVSLSWWPLAERGGGQCVAVNWRTFLPGHISVDPWCFSSGIHVCLNEASSFCHRIESFWWDVMLRTQLGRSTPVTSYP